MKIAMIGSRGLGTSYGGIERVLDAVCPELVALGHTVHVYAAASSATSKLNNLEVIKVPCLDGKHTETISRSVIATSRAISRYDIVHFHAIGPGILTAATWLFRQPSVVTIHGLDQRRDKWGPIAKTCLSTAESIIVNCADRVTVVSEELRDLRTSFIPNGLPKVTDLPRGPLLASLGLTDRRYVFFASRLTPEKGCHDLIEAHSKMGSDVALVIAGKALEPDYEAHLRQMAGPNVIFVGHRSGAELQELYSNAALFVLPSYIEGMSMALLEAMAYGLPIVVSDIPENLRVVDDTALRFRTRDVDDLAVALRQGLARTANNASSPTKWPTWSQVAQHYSDVYSRAIAQPVVLSGARYGKTL
jgi:glycosyltransferase involved in cell wall biosynthesis